MTSKMKDTLLLIGGNANDRKNLRIIFEPHYYLLEAENIEQGKFLLELNSKSIAAVIADVPVVREDMRALVETANTQPDGEIPVIFMIPVGAKAFDEEQAFHVGAADVVRKPCANVVIKRRVQILVDLFRQRWHLESEVQEKNKVLHTTYQSMLDTMSAIIECRDVDSGNHSLRMRGLTRILLQEVAQSCPEYGLDQVTVDVISNASALHDIGKISIPDAILNKPGPLTPEEMAIMKTHTTVGADLITRLKYAGDMKYLQYAYNICLSHHERWDGNGYPNGLRGDEIPICAQVTGLIDAFDALTNKRSYKSAFSYETAVNMICNGECGAFSPKLLECFKHICGVLIQFADDYSDDHHTDGSNIAVPLEELIPQSHAMDAMQMAHLKYQSLLHYINDTVIELDVDNKVYHVVNNPNPDFISLLSNADFDELAFRMMDSGVHPEDVDDVLQMQKSFSRQLFAENQSKCTFRCRIFNPPQNAYLPYLVTLLRVNTENPKQRVVLAVFHDLEEAQLALPVENKPLLQNPNLYEIVNPVICCRADAEATILEGIHMLLPLTGHTAREIVEQFGNSLCQLVLPEDRSLLVAATINSHMHAGSGHVRLRHKNGSIVWAAYRCRLHVDTDGIQYVYYAFTDVTDIKWEALQQTRDYARYQMVVNQFKNVVFEWDLQEDTFFSTAIYEERFGYCVPTKDFGRAIAGRNHVHPDDLLLLRKKIELLSEKEGKEHLDLRISNSDGRYLWSRIRAISKAENGQKPTNIIGVIYDIDDLKKNVLDMQEKVQQDVLTKLLNKESTKQAVSVYLESMTEDAKAAVLMLDLDNFKAINDTYGHLYGDSVLNQIGATLRNLFRTWDVIGRIGGDEFLVLLKDVPNMEVVKDRCGLLVETFRKYFHDLMPELNVSMSVGCVMIPEHGKTWAEVYQRADIALYAAKHKGKCQYSVYSPGDALLKSGIPNTRIDSNDQSVVTDESFMRFAFHNLYTSRNVEKTIDILLAHIGIRFNVSRVYIFENNDANTHCSNTFEWCNVGVQPEIENLQNVSYETDAPNWPSYFDENGVVYCPDVTKLTPELRAILEPQGIKSLLHCAIMYDGVFRGYIGFDECNANHMWTQEQVELLRFFAEILSVFLYRYRHSKDGAGKLTGVCPKIR